MVQRVTYRRRKSFNTKSNKIRKVKTPGGKLAVQYLQKKPKGVMCGDCHKRLQGIPQLRPKEYSRIPRRQKTVTRAYGGSRCGKCVRQRIVRAFLVEEQKIVKKVLKAQSAGKA
mmetsp:Transcript_16018/g.46737  ORF Transcript_16018/g.46737 Transcript_16018/m.46737 type:complete len:114 (-) Transcript_16018:649-990(-)